VGGFSQATRHTTSCQWRAAIRYPDKSWRVTGASIASGRCRRYAPTANVSTVTAGSHCLDGERKRTRATWLWARSYLYPSGSWRVHHFRSERFCTYILHGRSVMNSDLGTSARPEALCDSGSRAERLRCGIYGTSSCVVPSSAAQRRDPKFRELGPRGQLVAATGGHLSGSLTADDGPTDIP
jgi:hypothetical protein